MRSLIQVRCRPGLRLGAAVDHAVEIAVDGDLELVRSDGAGEPRRHVEAVERDDPAQVRLDPVERGVLRAVGHREDAAGIGLEQHFRGDLDDRRIRGWPCRLRLASSGSVMLRRVVLPPYTMLLVAGERLPCPNSSQPCVNCSARWSPWRRRFSCCRRWWRGSRAAHTAARIATFGADAGVICHGNGDDGSTPAGTKAAHDCCTFCNNPGTGRAVGRRSGHRPADAGASHSTQPIAPGDVRPERRAIRAGPSQAPPTIA